MDNFQDALRKLLNQYSRDNDCNTPDFMLAQYIEAQVKLFESTMSVRDMWFSKE